ncbi:MAG: uncharacterized protein KVP18_003803 [Porospora cf. gigantea A]|uniref:uncharacterized protein n=1 Tax=Porospora cf. gigantea A TaxID=2853593 RepID=UPI00355A7F5F|nr:MAG: hypothetical protein KVP18_003803 [Porospora cf. gigantea A]
MRTALLVSPACAFFFSKKKPKVEQELPYVTPLDRVRFTLQLRKGAALSEMLDGPGFETWLEDFG